MKYIPEFRTRGSLVLGNGGLLGGYFGKAARQRAENMFSKENNIQAYLDVYKKLLNNEWSV